MVAGGPALRKSPPSEMLSTQTETFLDKAIQDCEANHSKCKVNRDTSFLPTRLVDISEDPPKLVESSKLINRSGSRPKYAALSYVWGPGDDAANQLKTTNQNVDDHRDEIPLEKLPALLKDTMETVKKFDIQFLWVDSLCILQCSGEDTPYNKQRCTDDWNKESAKAHQIYGNAYITICPVISKSCQRGFLFRSPPSILMPYSQDKAAGKYRIRYQRSWMWKMYFNTPFHPFHQDIISGSWVRRGWTFQEAALSSRTIILGSTSAHFQCKEIRRTQGEQQEIPVTVNHLDLGVFPLLPHIDTRDQFHSVWRKIISSYTQRRFGRPQNEIAALAGLAQHFQSLHLPSFQQNNEYCSGMWSCHLHEYLLWRQCMWDGINWPDFVQPLSSKVPNEVKTYAPSWTWVHKRNVEYEYLDNAIGLQHDGRDQGSSPDLLSLKEEITELDWVRPNGSEDKFMSWKGQELRIQGWVAPFPSSTNVSPAAGEAGGELNTDLFWKWTIDDKYFCHTNWDHLKLDQWKDIGIEKVEQVRMLLLSSGASRYDSGYNLKENRPSDCGSDSVAPGQRVAFGLLLYPKDATDRKLDKENCESKKNVLEYYRVGTWHSFPKGKGGLEKLKEAAEEKRIILV